MDPPTQPEQIVSFTPSSGETYSACFSTAEAAFEQGEYQIYEYLQNLQSYWTTLNLPFPRHHQRIPRAHPLATIRPALELHLKVVFWEFQHRDDDQPQAQATLEKIPATSRTDGT